MVHSCCSFLRVLPGTAPGVVLSDAGKRNRGLDRPPPSGAAWCGSTATRQRREPQALCAAKRGYGSGPETGLDRKYPRDGTTPDAVRALSVFLSRPQHSGLSPKGARPQCEEAKQECKLLFAARPPPRRAATLRGSRRLCPSRGL